MRLLKYNFSYGYSKRKGFWISFEKYYCGQKFAVSIGEEEAHSVTTEVEGTAFTDKDAGCFYLVGPRIINFLYGHPTQIIFKSEQAAKKEWDKIYKFFTY